jgi:hypothetical protein
LKQGANFVSISPEWFFEHWANFTCQNGGKVIDERANLKLDRVIDLPYSPDPSACDFSRLGILKQNIIDLIFQTIEETMTIVQTVRDEPTLDDLQSIFFNWSEQFEWVVEHERGCDTN